MSMSFGETPSPYKPDLPIPGSAEASEAVKKAEINALNQEGSKPLNSLADELILKGVTEAEIDNAVDNLGPKTKDEDENMEKQAMAA